MAKLNRLSDPECKSATTKGKAIRKLHDGGGLYLWVYADGRKYWRLRYKIAGSERSLSLGVYPAIGLKKARNCRDEERQRLEDNFRDRCAGASGRALSHGGARRPRSGAPGAASVRAGVPVRNRHRLRA